jgi:hypothetical protein
MGPRLRGDDGGVGVDALRIFRFKFQTAKCLRSRAAARVGLLVFLPFLRGDGTPKGAPCNRPRLISRIAGKQRHTATPLSVPPRRLLRPWDLTYRHRREQARHPGRLPHPSPAPSQPFKAEPRSGLGRLPKAPRVHACEAWPQAPHPTGLGYPAPAKLSLCPTSERLMKRPSLDRTRAG